MKGYTSKLKTDFEEKFRADLQKELGLANTMAVPRLDKIVVNAGLGKEARNNSSAVSEFAEDLAIITGQKPVITKSKKAISNFKLRENTDNGVKVTLRGERMWDFFDRLVNIALPRTRDFRGVSRRSWDGHGNFAVGITEHTIFPEIDTSNMAKIRPMQVVITTTANDDEQGLALLEKLGMPFRSK